MTGDRGKGPDGQGPGGANGVPGDGAPGRSEAQPPRIPPPRSAADDAVAPPAVPPQREPVQREPAPEQPVRSEPVSGAREERPGYEHRVLKSLLGAWALAACSPEEERAVQDHLTGCPGCAEEASRLRAAVGLLHPEDSLDLDPGLRSHVLEGCLGRRPARVPVPPWAAPYEAETARLDALLRDMAADEWTAPVRLRWFDGTAHTARDTTVAGVIAHLLAVDGLVARALGLSDPLVSASSTGLPAPPGGGPSGPVERTEVLWKPENPLLRPLRARNPWREQSRTMVRSASFKAEDVHERDVDYGAFTLPVADALVERAFETWVHAGDIAEAVDYPYGPPAGEHLHRMLDYAARMLPDALAGRQRAGLATSAPRLTTAGAPGRTLHLEIEGTGGGDWYIPLDSPGAEPSRENEVAHVALDGVEFCQLAAGHIPPAEAAAGLDGDRDAVHDVLFAAASLSRL